ncbi:MAG: tyrosine-type recombinase/integrase, partial [Oscillospiraceae bacterium]|nr:tyrosine-type recombinase/integrase [Oscillospiraceae bacterium]
TARSNRYIGMSDTLIELFTVHRKHYEEKVEYLGELFQHPEMIFTSESGNFVDRSFLNLQFRRFVKGTSFEFATLHTLRHCNATLLINSGIDLKIVSELLGHSDVSTTANVYADVLDSSKAKVADLISLKLK